MKTLTLACIACALAVPASAQPAAPAAPPQAAPMPPSSTAGSGSARDQPVRAPDARPSTGASEGPNPDTGGPAGRSSAPVPRTNNGGAQ